jgi:putative sugar O-methyltransferase
MIPFQLHRRIPLLRRPFHQRDLAMEQCDQLRAERDCIIAERDLAVRETERLRGKFIETANATLPATPFGRTSMPEVVDPNGLIARIIAAYRASTEATTVGSPGVWDSEFFKMKRDIHDALFAVDQTAAQTLLRDPCKTDLFYGFDIPARRTPADDSKFELDGLERYRELLLLSEVLGARRVWNSEAPKLTAALPDVETMMLRLDQAVGFRIDLPNPFPDEIGLVTSRGIASYRAVQALYQAARIASLIKEKSRARIAEIGAGTGRTGYYARKIGITDYTIIDLPMSNVAQANFLGRALGPDIISLFGENQPGVRILPPSAFLDGDDHFDLVVNVDSLTEMTAKTAHAYCKTIKASTGLFLSINHELNPLTVREVCAGQPMFAHSRTPYWMRNGYVKELFTL